MKKQRYLLLQAAQQRSLYSTCFGILSVSLRNIVIYDIKLVVYNSRPKEQHIHECHFLVSTLPLKRMVMHINSHHTFASPYDSAPFSSLSNAFLFFFLPPCN